MSVSSRRSLVRGGTGSATLANLQAKLDSNLDEVDKDFSLVAMNFLLHGRSSPCPLLLVYFGPRGPGLSRAPVLFARRRVPHDPAVAAIR